LVLNVAVAAVTVEAVTVAAEAIMEAVVSSPVLAMSHLPVVVTVTGM
jgi:hypothetical protein